MARKFLAKDSAYSQPAGHQRTLFKQLLWVDGSYNYERAQALHVEELHEASAFVASLRACAKSKNIRRGSRLHDDILRKGMLEKCSDALVTMYAKGGALAKAQQLFDIHKSRDPITWTALIAGYAQNSQGQNVIDLFERMLHEGLSPDEVTFACILTACALVRAVDKGERIHDQIAKHGLLENNVRLGNALVTMYAKCGALVKARRVLEELPIRNVISWNALIAGYTQYGEGEKVLDCLEHMQEEGLLPNAVTFSCVLNACGNIRAADKGERIHHEVAKQGLLTNNVALGNALVDMYAKCGALTKAHQLLTELPYRNVITWSALIAGYAQHGKAEEALKCLEGMQREGLSPNAVTYSCILKACGSIGAMDKGEEIHNEIVKQGMLANNVVLGTALVDMYAKCGTLTKAQQTLKGLMVRNVTTWNALIAGYAQEGQGEQALNCLERLQHEGLSADAATYSCVLGACNRVGLVEAAQLYFDGMITNYDMKPDLEHYSCMVDLLGRAGYLEKAVAMVEEMPYVISGVWYAILGACQKWGDLNVGRWAFQFAVEVDKTGASVCVPMPNIYAAVRMQKFLKL